MPKPKNVARKTSKKKTKPRPLELGGVRSPAKIKLVKFLISEFSGPRPNKIRAASYNYNKLREMIWEFRKANGWKYIEGEYVVPKDYFTTTLEWPQTFKVDKEEFSVIQFLSSTRGINAIRQRGRMRRAPVPLSAEELKKLQTEMRSVLRWVFNTS